MPDQTERVIAGVALVIGVMYVAVARGAVARRDERLVGITRARITRLDRVYVPDWQARHPDACPRDVAEVAGEIIRDSYGTVLHLTCVPTIASWTTPTVVVISAGEDGVFNTADDLRSDRHEDLSY